MKNTSIEINSEQSKIIVFYDGLCLLCNSSVKFIAERDKKDNFRFANLQNGESRKMLERAGYSLPESENFESILVLSGNKVYDKSEAAILIVTKLGIPWNIFFAFRIIPRKLRDKLYMLISNNRYKIFGRSNSCFIPSEKEKVKFI